MTKELILSQGKVALVDDEDYEWLNQWKWYALVNNRGTFYAVRSEYGPQKRKTIILHRVILIAPVGMHVDHINGDGLDNRRCNLRLSTNSENLSNRTRTKKNTSGFKGVYWYKSNKKWTAQICVNFRKIYLGMYDDPKEAAHAYDKAAIEHFGEFAKTNRDMGLLVSKGD